MLKSKKCVFCEGVKKHEASKSFGWQIFFMILICIGGGLNYLGFSNDFEISRMISIPAFVVTLFLVCYVGSTLFNLNWRQRYVYRCIDPDGVEHFHLKGHVLLVECTVLKQKISAWGGNSELITPRMWHVSCGQGDDDFLLEDVYQNSYRPTSFAQLIEIVENHYSFRSYVENFPGLKIDVEKLGSQRDQLVGALVRLQELAIDERDTLGNSPYGQLVDHYIAVTLDRVMQGLGQEAMQEMYSSRVQEWDRVAEMAITRFGRR